MPKRETVAVNLPYTRPLIKKVFRSYVAFCEAMGRPEQPTWVSEWVRDHNLPSPEEAARMCALLNAMPEDILLEQKDIERVRELIAKESEKNDLPKEVDEDAQELIDIILGLPKDAWDDVKQFALFKKSQRENTDD